jgi:hypothetical protein
MVKKSNLHFQQVKFISSKDVINNNQKIDYKLKFDFETQKDKFQKEYSNSNHKVAEFTDKFFLWFKAPFKLRIWTGEKDTELGRFTWNTNALKNNLGKLFNKKGIRFLLLIGLLNGLLPCGFVYIAIAGATATGNYVNGTVLNVNVSNPNKPEDLIELATKQFLLLDIFPFPIIQDTEIRKEVTGEFGAWLELYFIINQIS